MTGEQPNSDSVRVEKPERKVNEKVALIVAGGMVISTLIVVVGFSPYLPLFLTIGIALLICVVVVVLIAGPNHWFGHPRDPKS